MEATFAPRLDFSTWIHTGRHTKNLNSTYIRFPHEFKRGVHKLQFFLSDELHLPNGSFRSRKVTPLGVSCSHEKSSATTLQYGNLQAPTDEELFLKNKSQEFEPLLDGRCIYLVGMMGSGKTTIGKILAEVLNYSFYDSDTLVEQDAGGTSVADIFKQYGESYFRDKESEVLRKVSLMHRLVVSTGGGTVLRPINWKFMQKGISVWLDVPVEALAQRIAAVGTNSRPLLHDESGDAYTKAFLRLSALFEERGESYANASARVSLENIAGKLGNKDVSDLSPTIIAIEALEQIGAFLKKKKKNGHLRRF